MAPLPCGACPSCVRPAAEGHAGRLATWRTPISPLLVASIEHPSRFARLTVRIRLAGRIHGYMDLVTIVLILSAVWAIGALAIVAVCRAAAKGDRVLRTQLSARRWYDSHERPLAA